MSMIGDYLNYREEMLAAMDCFIFGQSFIIKSVRKWYNPMRYILGESKSKRLDPRKCLIDPKDWKGIYRNAEII